MPGPGKPFTSETAAEAGRKSKKKGIEQQVQEFLDQKVAEGDTRTRLELIYAALMKFGLKGNVKALDILMDRGFGKAKQHVEMSGSIDIPPAQIIINGKITKAE